MDAIINGHRVSFNERYVQDVKRDEFIREQTKALQWLGTQKELAKTLAAVYDTVHPPKVGDVVVGEGE